MKYISYSRFSLYNTCPECYKYRYVMGLKGQKIAALDEGKAYHDNVDYYHKGLAYNSDLIKNYTRVFPPEYRGESEYEIRESDRHFLHIGTREIAIPFVGRVDGFNRGKYLSDLKFMSSNPAASWAKKQDQPTFYLWYHWNITGQLVPFFYQTVNKKTGRVSVIKTERSIDDFEDLFARLLKYIVDVTAEKFEATGSRCYWGCEYRDICSNCSKGGDR